MDLPFTASPRVAQAIAMAMQAHSTQPRLGTALPYIVHPISVAMALVPTGDENLVIAGLLHDAAEDTGLSVKKIRAAFGDDVADLVDTVTHRDGETKMDRIRVICAAGPRPVLLKLADNAHNLSDLDPADRRYGTYLEARAALEGALTGYRAAEMAQSWRTGSVA